MKAGMIIYVSTMIFVIMNIIENLVYYNIGKHTNEHSILKWSLDLPGRDDMMKIAAAIIVFSIIHVSLSCLFVKCYFPFNL